MEKEKKTYFGKQDNYFIITRNVLESSAQHKSNIGQTHKYVKHECNFDIPTSQVI